MVSESRGFGDTNVNIDCNVHIAANCFTKTFKLLEGNIRGMAQFALSLGSSQAMGRFRDAIAEEVRSRLEVKRGCCSEEGLAYKR